jgi:hypothetical protein
MPSPAHAGAGHDRLASPRLADSSHHRPGYASSAPVSQFPPQLPPIPRVASKLHDGRRRSLLSPQHATIQAQGPETALRSPLPVMHELHEQFSPPHNARRPPAPSLPAESQPTGRRLQGQTLAHVVDMTMHAESPPTTTPSSRRRLS